ncbi:MAG: DEAD/DEAH box helicase [Campylobacterota bacterium]|nr:DEAD/DEAH box helicase [Campylobacterota bacterium]
MTFEQLNLSKQILKTLDKNDFVEATEIQEKVIPLVLNGSDVMGKARTSSGKTASFVLPILEDYIKQPIATSKKIKRKIKALILTPTRELTIQVADVFKTFSEFLPYYPKVVTIIGGEDISKQLIEIQKGCDIVVATSGRLIDIVDKKQINLGEVKYFVLDEADKMLDIGFSEELDKILTILPTKRQNLLFSATYPQKIVDICSKITKNSIKVTIEKESKITLDIKQRAILVNKVERSLLLQDLIRKNSWDRVLVFMSNKRATDNIANKFRKFGFLAQSFHGDLEQDERNLTLQEFKDKKIKILFSTDIASRGLHIDDISCVINFDLPRGADDYIHRIGRTGRSGKKGVAISFLFGENLEHFKLIEKRCELDIKKEELEKFKFTDNIQKTQKGKAPVKGKRKSKKDKLRELNLN